MIKKIPNQYVCNGLRNNKPVMYEVSRRFFLDMILLTITLSSIMFIIGVQVGKFF